MNSVDYYLVEKYENDKFNFIIHLYVFKYLEYFKEERHALNLTIDRYYFTKQEIDLLLSLIRSGDYSNILMAEQIINSINEKIGNIKSKERGNNIDGFT